MTRRNTDIQQRILATIISYIKKHRGRSPTYREIAEAAQISSLGHLAYHLKHLEDKQFIRREGHKSRTITALRNWQGLPLDDFANVAAGPKYAIPNQLIEGNIPISSLFPTGAFTLNVAGDSMIGDGILNGDTVIVDPEQRIEIGDIVVATYNDTLESEFGEATIKRIYQEGSKIRLQPSNPSIEPIVIDVSEWEREWKLQGKVIAVIHELH
jgi:repressor LexA